MPTEEIVRIAQQVASGLAAAHGQGLVHRDIKPANILLEDGVERVTLTDFGLARAVDDASMTRSGVIAGTPQYMSPEQARGDNVDARSDLFSLGSVMYAMCTGRAPFRAETSYGILRRITDTEPRPIREVNPNIPEWLERIIQRLLAKSLEDRIPTAEHAATLLQKCLAHIQQPTIVELPEECRVPQHRSVYWPTSLRTFRVVSAIAVSCLVITGIYSITQWPSGNSRPATVSTTTSNNPETSIAADLSPLADWDAIQTEIDAFENDLIPSEADASKLWQTTPERNPP